MVKVVAEGEAYLAPSVQGEYSEVLQKGTCERHTTHVRRNNLQGSENEPDSITQQTVDCTTDSRSLVRRHGRRAVHRGVGRHRVGG